MRDRDKDTRKQRKNEIREGWQNLQKTEKRKERKRPGREASIGCWFFDVLRYQNTTGLQ